MKPAIFLERDGVLNQPRVNGQYPASPLTLDEFVINREVAPWLQKLRSEGFLLVVTTNQPGLSRGYQSRRHLDRMHEALMVAMPIQDILVCPHDETDGCPCRKPKPGMLLEASFRYQINLEQSFVLSDKWQDAEAGRAVGCTSVLIKSPWTGAVHRDFLVPSFARGVEKILQARHASWLVPA